jgi:carbamoyltransferase
MKGTYLGPEFSDSDIEKLIRKYNSKASKFESFDDLIDQVTSFLISGNTIGWFQGRMEFGPRALGNRSIIADPGNPEMQSVLNLKIKYRESFRPFAASVLEEDKNEFFDISCNSPYMLMVSEVNNNRKYNLPDNYKDMAIKEKLYHKRSDLQSITHVDYTCRLHTVNRSANEKYWKLIDKFKEKTSLGLLINTSFNVRGEPIVCSPEDAYRCFLNTELDILVIENYLFLKSDQNIPDSKEVDKWKNSFILD